MHTRTKHLLPLMLLCIAVFALALCASAETWTGKCGDNLTYTLDTDTGALTISGTGEMFDRSWSYNYCDMIRTVTIEDGVASIGDDAFLYCSNLTSITIPNSVTSIGGYAFLNCSSLKSVTIPNSVTSIGNGAFNDCNSLTDMIIGNGVKSIGGYAFFNCTGLKGVTIPDSVTNIGNGAFDNCPALLSVIPGSFAQNYAKENRVPFATTDGAASEIADSGSCGDSLTWQLDWSGVLTITGTGRMEAAPWSDWNNGYSNRNLIRVVVLPDGLTSICESAFASCCRLNSVSIPDSVTDIGNRAFESCGCLTSIQVGADNPNYASLDGALFNKDKTTLIQAPGGVSAAYAVPDGVTRIGEFAFNDCRRIKSITIPTSVAEIGNWAFVNTEIENVYISDLAAWCAIDFQGEYTNPVHYWGESPALYLNGAQLTQVEIPADITKISSVALSGFTSMTQITVSPDNPNYTDADGVLFSKDKTVLLTAPAGMMGSYTVPAGVTTVADTAFHHTKLTDVSLQSGTSIGNNAFYRSGIVHVTLPDGLLRICEQAFYLCNKLESISLPDSLTDIGASAFYGCESLESITIPVHVKGLYSQAFDYCENLASITILNPDCEIEFDDTIPENATIYGYIGSTAEAYAKEYDRTFVALQGHKHIYADGYTVDTPATCTAVGSKSRHCTVEGCDAKTDITEIPKTAHTYVDGVCKGCGKVKPASTPGVVTGDGEKPMKKDLLRLQKYLAGWNVEIDEAAADCNGDGKITKVDLLRLQKYLAGWDVTLGE